jgi:hypothetical protein
MNRRRLSITRLDTGIGGRLILRRAQHDVTQKATELAPRRRLRTIVGVCAVNFRAERQARSEQRRR